MWEKLRRGGERKEGGRERQEEVEEEGLRPWPRCTYLCHTCVGHRHPLPGSQSPKPHLWDVWGDKVAPGVKKHPEKSQGEGGRKENKGWWGDGRAVNEAEYSRRTNTTSPPPLPPNHHGDNLNHTVLSINAPSLPPV